MKKAVFLDRDGVINVDHGYTYLASEFDFIDGVFEACRRFLASGYEIVVVTNQAGIARGYYTELDFEKLTDWMLDRFNDEGISVAGVYHCPHHATEGVGTYKKRCDCRKPEPGMLLTAARELNIVLGQSIMVGDKISDMEAGRSAGVKTCILISDNVISSATHHSVDRQAKSLADVYLP